MFQIGLIVAVLVAAVSLMASSHGADMGQKIMEPASGGILALVMKYPLIFAGAAGSLIGALVVTSYQKKNRFQQFMVNASIAICLTPAFFAVSEQPATWDRWLACSLILGIFSGTILQIWISPDVQEAAKQVLAHQLIERLGGGDEKPTKPSAD